MKIKNESEKPYTECYYVVICIYLVRSPFTFFIYQCPGLGFMNGQENIRLSDFINVAKDPETNTWSARSTTVLASSTGVLPRTLRSNLEAF